MKNRLVFCCFLLLFFVAVPFLSAQSVKTLKSRGPMFITSLSFFQGITRIPHNVVPGEEGLTKNHRKVNNISLINASQFMGFQFSPHFALGLGIGFEYWTVEKGNAFVPVYADFRFNITDKKIAPHAYINLGYASRWYISSKPYKISTGNTTEYIIQGATSGIMGEVGFGIKASVGYSTAIVITACGKIQESALRYYSGITDPSQSMKPLLTDSYSNGLYFSAGIKVGVVF